MVDGVYDMVETWRLMMVHNINSWDSPEWLMIMIVDHGVVDSIYGGRDDNCYNQEGSPPNWHDLKGWSGTDLWEVVCRMHVLPLRVARSIEKL